MADHLWEVKHPYYCNEDHYFGTGSCSYSDMHPSHHSWDEFVSGMGKANMDLNLLFRWDWEEPEDRPADRDDNYRDGELQLTYFYQRKGFHIRHTVQVCRSDEPAVIDFLRQHAQHLVRLWEPILSPPESSEDAG